MVCHRTIRLRNLFGKSFTAFLRRLKMDFRIILVISFIGLSKADDNLNALQIRFECLTPRVSEGCENTGYTENDTYFYLFTRKNPDDPELLHDCDRKLPQNTNFDAGKPTEIIIDGYIMNPCLESWMREMKNELLKRGDYNVILVDWGNYALNSYFESCQGLKISANETVELINNIKKKTQAGTDDEYDDFHIVGHSLGAHLAGFVGKGTKIKRITALDPAGPGYHELPRSEKLDKTDAEYVDVIQTNAGRCLPHLGYLYPLGHDDFYVNGGTFQSSCFYAAFESLAKMDIIYGIASLAIPTLCFHHQSEQYYKPSVNPENHFFIGQECKDYQSALKEECDPSCKSDGSNCAVMGMDWLEFYNGNRAKPRIFSVKTSMKCPYFLPDGAHFNRQQGK